MTTIRYESVLIEQALSQAYAAEIEQALKSMDGLNDVKPLIADFEKEFARYIGVKNAVAVNSGSDALKMALLAAGLQKKDEVIVPDLTYQAVALAVVYCGGKPVAVDCRAEDLQLDSMAVKKAITKKTKAVIAAHMFGRPCDVEQIGKICRDKNIVFIEDVCQAESSRFQGRMLGGFGDIAVFSFSYYKPLSSCGGGGGMIVVNDQLGKRIRRWMEDWRDDGELLALGQRFAPMTFMDLMALRVKFSHLKEIIKSRQKIKELYEHGLEGLKGLTIYKDRPQTESVPQNFVVCHRDRDRMIDYLTAQEIMVQRPYVPLHRMGAFKHLRKAKFPVSEMYAATALHLPLYSFMSPEKARRVIECCRLFLARGSKGDH